MSPASWRSPVSGVVLHPDTAHSLAEPGRRWPVVDGIPFLRVGREGLAGEALARLDRGDRECALVALLADQDDWWTGPPASAADLRRLVRKRDSLTLRDAMRLLAWGRVGDYFAHRWSDPTFLAGLALLEAHWCPTASAFELACGIGHYGREFLRRDVAYTGADVVFAKLWVARHWVLGEAARLVCFDAAAPWPIEGQRFDLALCQDAFYFLEPKREILAALRRTTEPRGRLSVGHVHNRAAANLSAGAALEADEIAALFPDGIVYDDAELTRALVEACAPVPARPDALRTVEAFAVAAGPGLDRIPRPLTAGFAIPLHGAALQLNPLYSPDPGLTSLEPLRRTQHVPPRTGEGGREAAGWGKFPVANDLQFQTPSAPACAGAPSPARGRTPAVTRPSSSEHVWCLAWPSERYREEYEALATYPRYFTDPETPDAHAGAIRCRALVDLPERW